MHGMHVHAADRLDRYRSTDGARIINSIDIVAQLRQHVTAAAAWATVELHRYSLLIERILY